MYKFRKSCLMRSLAILLLASVSLLLFEDTASAWPWDFIVEAVESVGEEILDTATDAVEVVKDTVTTAVDTVTEGLTDVAITVADATVTVAKEIGEAVVTTAETIGKGVVTVAETAGNTLVSIADTVDLVVSKVFDNTLGFLENNLGIVGDALKYMREIQTAPFSLVYNAALSTATLAGKGAAGTLETTDLQGISKTMWESAGQALTSHQKAINEFSAVAANNLGTAGGIAGSITQAMFASVGGSMIDALNKSESLSDKVITGDATLDDLKEWAQAVSEVAADAASLVGTGGSSAALTATTKTGVFLAKNQGELAKFAVNLAQIAKKKMDGEKVTTEEWVKLGSLGAQVAAGAASAYLSSPGLKSDADFAKKIAEQAPNLYTAGNTAVNMLNGDNLSTKDYIKALTAAVNAAASIHGAANDYGKSGNDDDGLDVGGYIIEHVGSAGENFVDLQNAPQATSEEESEAIHIDVNENRGTPVDGWHAIEGVFVDEMPADNWYEIQDVFTQVNMANTSPTVPQMPMGGGGFFSNLADLIGTTIAETSESFITDLTKTPQSVTFTIEIQQQ